MEEENKVAFKPPATAKNKPSGERGWYWIVMMVVLVLVGAGVWYFWNQNRTNDVVTSKTQDKTTTGTASVKEDWVVGSEILKSNTTSTDGKSFEAGSIAIDSAKEDNYFASVPDLIKTPDGKIRMYYVSGGQAIGSALSVDNGKTWIRESGYRLEDSAVDPDVSYKDGRWVMYYSVLDPAKNALYKATSTDGLKWENETKLFDATTGGAIVDPDVIEITPTDYVMFLGQSSNGGSTGGEQINLYSAELTQSIF